MKTVRISLLLALAVSVGVSSFVSAQEISAEPEKVVQIKDGRLAIDPTVLDRSSEPVIAINEGGQVLVMVPESTSGAALATATTEWLNQGTNLQQLQTAIGRWKRTFRPSVDSPDMITHLNNNAAAWLQQRQGRSTLTRAEIIKDRAVALEMAGTVLDSGPMQLRDTSFGVLLEQRISTEPVVEAASGCGPQGRPAKKVYCCSWGIPPCHFCDCSASSSGCCMYGFAAIQQNVE